MSDDEELKRLKEEVHSLRGELTMTKIRLRLMEGKLQGQPLYSHWNDAEAPRVTVNDEGCPIRWHITLNGYQRSNLLWLMCDLVGYCKPGVEPFTFANTGDWAGEIPNMLRDDHRKVIESPNTSVDQVRQRVEEWKRRT